MTRTNPTPTGLRPPVVRRATAEDAPRLARTLERAFHEDPVVAWFLPDRRRRERGGRRMFEQVFLRRICLPEGETYTTDDLTGAALWLPPERWRTDALHTLRLLPYMAAAWGRYLPRALRGLAYTDRKHPDEPHYYLLILGVEPERQGRGIGTALMRPVLERCDREGRPAYLEATAPRNRELYRRHGFTVIERCRMPGDGPSFWRMWREPGA